MRWMMWIAISAGPCTGETAAEHDELMKFCREFKFERLGAFAYSEEDGTPAAQYPDQVDQAVRDLRRDQLIQMQQAWPPGSVSPS